MKPIGQPFDIAGVTTK